MFQDSKNQLFELKTLFTVVFLILFLSCATHKPKATSKRLLSKVEEGVYKNQFTGLLIVDTKTNDTIVSSNANKYFIPASTTKLFTLYAAKKMLSEKIPTLKYTETKDTLYIEGTGDPTWLHANFTENEALNFLSKTNKTIALYLDNYTDDVYRPGWAWEDYQYYFSAELSAIPLYGNVLQIIDTSVTPKHAKETMHFSIKEKPSILRHRLKNEFYLPKTNKDTLLIPYITSKNNTKHFLEAALKREIHLSDTPLKKPKQVLYGIATDTILKQMLYESDNFLAEQLMLVAASTISDTLSFDIAKNEVLKNHLSDLKQAPRWVDGSGLSRYNLFTPETMVQLLQKLHETMGEQQLLELLPSWNVNGTLKNPKSKDTAFIFAKSGSMGNTYNLCGYLKTKSGKLLSFSFMNNHFRIPSKLVRVKINETLTLIHENY